MIHKINNIKNFGVFKNFNGSSLTEFRTFNLIYGWNYSGKTTLSRVFRCIEKSQLHGDYSAATFELTNQTETYDHSFALTPIIRVFNSDFVRDNLKWDDENIDPIFLLGEENIELQTELAGKKTALAIAEETQAQSIRSRHEKQSQIDTALTDRARLIGASLSLRTFNRTHLMPIVEDIKLSPQTLSEEVFEAIKTQATSTDQKPMIDAVTFDIVDIASLKSEVEEILYRQTASGNKIQKLLDDQNLSDWVEEGRSIHEDKSQCEFCGGDLPTDLFGKLNAHFSSEYELLKADIESQLDKLNRSKIELTNLLPAELAFYTDIQNDFSTQKSNLENQVRSFNVIMDSLIRDITAKQGSPFDRHEITDFSENRLTLVTALANFNTLISTNNTRTQGFQTAKEAAIEKIKKHLASEFVIEKNYTVVQTELADEQIAIDTGIIIIEQQKKAILDIEAQLNETTKGAEKINDYLGVFFGKDDIKIEATEDNKFQLKRGSDVAKNLSEGEKTAISFAYFTAKIEEQGNDMINTIVYIDDPISSLDSNHLFNIYSFIKNTFYELKIDPTTNKKIHHAKCKQLFISTHNFDFHNLLYDWFKKLKKEMHSCLIVERHKNAHKDESVLKENSNLLTVFNSEYAYLFSILHTFQSNPTDTYDFLYHLPNISRRFVETFLNFKYLAPGGIDDHINELIPNGVDAERTRKFLHYHSHSLTTDKFVRLTDLAECQSVIDIIIEAVKANDPVHHKALTETVAQHL